MKGLRWIGSLSAAGAVAVLLLAGPVPFSLQDPQAAGANVEAGPSPDGRIDRSDTLGIHRLHRVHRIVLELTNEERRKAGLQALRWESRLAEIASAHSADMIARSYAGHVDPDGVDFQRRLARGHRRLVGLGGENVWKATGYTRHSERRLAEIMVSDWMGSASHRENILRAGFTHLGVGVCRRDDVIAGTQVFAEVQAYLSEPVPVTLATGERLPAGPKTLGDTEGRLRMFDLWNFVADARAGGPFRLDEPMVSVPPGVYRLRFYFEDRPGRFVIYTGPEIDLEPAAGEQR